MNSLNKYKIFIRNFQRGLKDPYLFYKYYNKKKYNNKNKKIRELINQKRLIYHFCTPKSASTYLAYLLELNSKNHIYSLPFYADRKQITDFTFLYNQIIGNKFNNKEYFSVHHQHTIYDSFLEKYISDKHIVIIQFRNIYKTLLSLKDYIISENITNKNPFARWDQEKYNDKDILKLLIFNYVPFHVNFIKTWVESKIRGKKIFINYESFIKNEKCYLEKIFIGYDKKNIIVPEMEKIDKKSINFKLATKRENTLSIDEKKYIDEIVDIHTKHSNPNIKSLIYQN